MVEVDDRIHPDSPVIDAVKLCDDILQNKSWVFSATIKSPFDKRDIE
jgi:hypothetical protein